MIPILITAIGGFFEELGTSIAKRNIIAKAASIYTIGFLNTLAPASVITSAKRSVEVLWSVLSGHMIFKEKRFAVKVAAFALITVGIAFLV